MAEKSMAIAEVSGREIAPSFLGELTGPTGFENISSDCISIPFLRLAQSNSPQALPGKDKLKGLQAGQYFNPTIGRVYEKAEFIILGFFRSWNIWHGEPPDSNFVKSVTPEEFISSYEAKTRKDEKTGKIIDADGNRYVDSRNFLLLSAEHPEDGTLLYSMSSTGIPASKKWLAKASAVRVKDGSGSLQQAPMWSRVWELNVSFEQKPKGSYFQVNDIQDKGWIPEGLAKPVRLAFEEAQTYDRSRIVVVEKAAGDDTPEWAK